MNYGITDYESMETLSTTIQNSERIKPLAVVLLSGGMDSTVCVAIAREMGYEVAALHTNYGQRTEQRELRAYHEVCNYYGIERRLVVDISHLAQIGGSSLTDSSMAVTVAHLEAQDIPTSYVPFRNANIVAIATSWAEVLSAHAIVIGAVEEDGSGYPDCRQEFFTALEHAINLGTKPSTIIHIITPVIAMSKQDIVETGLRLKAPLHLSWSCYQGDTIACGVCDSCALRLRGFYRAGVEDPIAYHVRPIYA
jgi:7-cyano-7-deazaguanine synthase